MMDQGTDYSLKLKKYGLLKVESTKTIDEFCLCRISIEDYIRSQ